MLMCLEKQKLKKKLIMVNERFGVVANAYLKSSFNHAYNG